MVNIVDYEGSLRQSDLGSGSLLFSEIFRLDVITVRWYGSIFSLFAHTTIPFISPYHGRDEKAVS